MQNVNSHLLGELCHILITRHNIQSKRQSARSRANILQDLYHFMRSGEDKKCSNPHARPGYTKWKKLSWTLLKAEIKKNRAKQLMAEHDLHVLSSKTTKRVRKLVKELDIQIINATGQNKVSGLVLPNNKYLSMAEICELADMYAAETILLKGEEIRYV